MYTFPFRRKIPGVRFRNMKICYDMSLTEYVCILSKMENINMSKPRNIFNLMTMTD
jgi:hypothetical protein